MTIRELAYELYKIEWKRRISPGIQMDVIKNYYQEFDEEDRKEYTFEDYIFDYGYFGQLYVCYGEFLNAEYLDESYMRYIFDSSELFEEYQKDLELINREGE